MSGHYYPPTTSSGEDSYQFDGLYHAPETTAQRTSSTMFVPDYSDVLMTTAAFCDATEQWHQPTQQYDTLSDYNYQYTQSQSEVWSQVPVLPSHQYTQSAPLPFPTYADTMDYFQQPITTEPPRTLAGYLSPSLATRTRISRSTSFASNASSTRSIPYSDVSRSASPNAAEMGKWGVKNEDGSWSCAWPGCSSLSTFSRGCDLRKHYKRHRKSLFCRIEGCPSSTEGGFSSKKDRDRHEAKHNPTIVCEWEGCGKLFSRQDNMKDHVRRIHIGRTT